MLACGYGARCGSGRLRRAPGAGAEAVTRDRPRLPRRPAGSRRDRRTGAASSRSTSNCCASGCGTRRARRRPLHALPPHGRRAFVLRLVPRRGARGDGPEPAPRRAEARAGPCPPSRPSTPSATCSTATRRGRKRGSRSCCATTPCSRCCTARASGCRSCAVSTSTISTSIAARPACSARARRSASSRSAFRPAGRSGAYLTRGRPALRARARSAGPAAGAAVFLGARGGRIAPRSVYDLVSRALGPLVGSSAVGPARPAPFRRDASARRGSRPAGRAGAARPREPGHDPDLHARVVGASGCDLPAGASPRLMTAIVGRVSQWDASASDAQGERLAARDQHGTRHAPQQQHRVDVATVQPHAEVQGARLGVASQRQGPDDVGLRDHRPGRSSLSTGSSVVTSPAP